jgi:drug/metabolite transporter (DMT)-like permease
MAVGVIATSFASIFIRFADAPALVIAAYRVTLASLILALPTWMAAREELRVLTGRDLRLAFFSGVFLAFHFATWIASLDYTTVASSVVLVNTNPLFVALMSHLLLRERVSQSTMSGITVTVAGGIIIGYGDLALGGQQLLGDLLALTGAVMGAAYFLIGRSLRPKLSLLAYIFVTYATAAVMLLAMCVLTRQPFTGYSPHTYLMFLLLAVVPQIIGHSSYNWALRYISATLVAVMALGEPISATILAAVILKEIPTVVKLIGGLLILVGIYITSRVEQAAQAQPAGAPCVDDNSSS